MKKMSTLLCYIASLVLLTTANAFAAYPDKPIRLVVGSAREAHLMC